MNIIICCTPLQVLIAERIMELYPDEPFFAIGCMQRRTEKLEAYLLRLKEKCQGGGIIISEVTPATAFQDYKRTLSLYAMAYRIPKPRRVFVSNIEKPTLHALLHRSWSAEIITFDDGTRNLVETLSASDMADIEDGIFQRALSRLMHPPLRMKDLFLRKKKHYSIYNYPNSMGQSEYIELFPREPVSADEEQAVEIAREVSIFLGQPIYEFDHGDTWNIALSKSVVEKYRPDYYLPHPREQYHIEGVEYLNTPYILEEYLVWAMVQHPHWTFHVYSFCSTALLNVCQFPQVEITVIKPSILSPKIEGVYDLLSRFGFSFELLEFSLHDSVVVELDEEQTDECKQ